MKGLISELTRTQEDIYEGMQTARAPALRSLEKTIQAMVPRIIGTPETVLEIGAGDGFLKRTLKPTAKWTEFDKYGINTEGRVVGDATKLPFKKESFDAVVGYESFNAFSYEDLTKTVGESMRVLKPGGHFLVFHDFGIADDTTHKLLGDIPIRTRITTGGKLPSSTTEYIPKENIKEYEKIMDEFSKKELSLKSSFEALFGEEPKELAKYWKELTNGEQLTMFHDYIKSLIEDKCESMISGDEIEDNIFRKRKGQELLNVHGRCFNQDKAIATVNKNNHTLSSLRQVMTFGLPAREIVFIAYTAAKKK